MRRVLIFYALALVGAALALEWLEYRYLVRAMSTEVYMAILAVGFTALGVWIGFRLTPARPMGEFAANERAIQSLGISERQLEVLELLAVGHSNKEIAQRLHVSPHTVKTHLGHLYGKLEVSRRTQAVQKARSLQILP